MTLDASTSHAPAAHDVPPAREMLRVALPAIVTMLSYVVMQFADTLIVARLGPGSIAAVGNGGIFAFVLGSFIFGLLAVVNTFVSQHYGAGAPEKGAAYAWNGLWLAAAAWIAVMLPAAWLFPALSSGAASLLGTATDPGVAAAAADYGRISLIGMIFMLGARGMSHYFYGIHRAKWVMVAALTANIINVPVSIVLVYGWWGFPMLGVAGAAIGTVIGSAFELGLLMAVYLSPKFARELGTRSAWRPSAAHIRKLLRLGWPAGLMLGNELFCWWVFMSFLIASFGPAHNDAAWITLRYMHVSFMPTVGLSMAVTAIVGRVVGAGRLDLATRRMVLGLKMAMAYMGVCALAMVVFREPLVSLFARLMLDAGAVHAAAAADEAAYIADVVRLGSSMLIVAAAFQVFDAVAITVVGGLRGAGDTVWPGLATAILSWAFLLGVGFATVKLAPGLGSLGPWLGAAGFIISLALALAWRWKSGRWQAMAVVKPRKAAFTGPSGEELGSIEPATAMPEAGGIVEPSAAYIPTGRADG